MEHGPHGWMMVAALLGVCCGSRHQANLGHSNQVACGAAFASCLGKITGAWVLLAAGIVIYSLPSRFSFAVVGFEHSHLLLS